MFDFRIKNFTPKRIFCIINPVIGSKYFPPSVTKPRVYSLSHLGPWKTYTLPQPTMTHLTFGYNTARMFDGDNKNENLSSDEFLCADELLFAKSIKLFKVNGVFIAPSTFFSFSPMFRCSFVDGKKKLSFFSLIRNVLCNPIPHERNYMEKPFLNFDGYIGSVRNLIRKLFIGLNFLLIRFVAVGRVHATSELNFPCCRFINLT